MDEYLPSIVFQKGNNYNNDNYHHQRFSSVGNKNKKFYNNYNKYVNNYRIKEERNSNNYVINFLKLANTNKDEINSKKNNTALTYYNKSYLNNKKSSSNNKLNNIFPETYYTFYQKFKVNKAVNNKSIKSYNNIKVIQGNISNINNNYNDSIKNLNLLLPNFTKQKNNINKRQNILKNGYSHSHSVSNKENKMNIINNINNNTANNLKNISNSINNEKIVSQKIIPKTNDNVTPNYPFFQINSYSKTTGTNQDNQFMKPYKTNTLFNKNNNSSNKRKCHLCNKEIKNYIYKFHVNLHPSKIFNWLFLGSYRNACNKQEIKDIGINYVLNCAIECMESFPAGIKYCHLKLSDSPSFKIIHYLEKATSFINQAQINNGVILVHCQLGISRSTSCVIAYMIKYMGYTAKNALNFIKKKRPQVMPNFGFLQQLMAYEKRNIGNGINIEKQNDSKNT